MEFDNLKFELSRVIKQRNIAIVSGAFAISIIFVQALVMLYKDTIVVVTPSVISKEYTITDRAVSKNYLEDMSRDVITTLFNLTPKNVSYMTETVLQMVHPSSYGKVKKELAAIQEDVIVRKVSTVFYPVSMLVDDENLIVHVEGDFFTFIGSSMTNQKRRTFEIKYNYTGAKLTIGGFSEVIK